jgi:hypothetical protein
VILAAVSSPATTACAASTTSDHATFGSADRMARRMRTVRPVRPGPLTRNRAVSEFNQLVAAIGYVPTAATVAEAKVLDGLDPELRRLVCHCERDGKREEYATGVVDGHASRSAPVISQPDDRCDPAMRSADSLRDAAASRRLTQNQHREDSGA